MIKYRNKLKIEKETLKQRLEEQKITHKSVSHMGSEDTSKKRIGTIFYNGASLESMGNVVQKEISIPSKYNLIYRYKIKLLSNQSEINTCGSKKILPALSLIHRKKGEEITRILPSEKSSLDTMVPKPGVIIVDRGYNRKSEKDLSEIYGQISRGSYNNRINHIISHFLPSISENRSNQSQNVEAAENESDGSIGKAYSFNHQSIKRNTNFNLNDLSTNKELIDGDKSPPFKSSRHHNQNSASENNINSIDEFNKNIIKNRNWGADVEPEQFIPVKSLPKPQIKIKNMRIKRFSVIT